MKIHLLRAEHFSVPGIITKAFVDLAGAEAEAMSLTNIMLRDNGQAQSANASNWRSKVEALQEQHGARNCYIDIVETPVQGSADGGQLAADLIMLERLIGTQDRRGLQDMRDIIARVQRDSASLADVLRRSESFIAGFEDDPAQEGIAGLLAAIRGAIAGAPNSELQSIRDAVKAYDDKLDDAANDGKNARAPDGDDYNKLLAMIMHGAEPDPVREAAHDVLAELKKAEAHIDHVCGETTEDDLPEWFSDLRTIRAAIAKAEGRADA